MISLLTPIFKPKPVVQQVLDLFASDPEGWNVDRHYCRHPTGFEIWIANHAYGLELTVEDGTRPFNRRRVLDAFDRYPVQRMHVWLAYRRWAPGRVRSVDEVEFRRAEAA